MDFQPGYVVYFATCYSKIIGYNIWNMENNVRHHITPRAAETLVGRGSDNLQVAEAVATVFRWIDRVSSGGGPAYINQRDILLAFVAATVIFVTREPVSRLWELPPGLVGDEQSVKEQVDLGATTLGPNFLKDQLPIGGQGGRIN